jgi:hypothetical protein
MALARRRYAGRWDFLSAEGWFRNIVLKQPMVFLPIRSPDAFLIAMINVVPWIPSEWGANVVMLCADEGKMWQAVGLARVSIEWARQRRCTEWRVSSETEHELGPIAKRLGAEELSPRYRMRF